MVKIEYANNPNKLQSELKKLNKIQVIDETIHEIENKSSKSYGGKFEMVGKESSGDLVRETHIGFRSISDYEHYINAIDQNYDSEDAIFNGYIYKMDTPLFNKLNRSRYGIRCEFKHEIVAYRSNKFFILTKVNVLSNAITI